MPLSGTTGTIVALRSARSSYPGFYIGAWWVINESTVGLYVRNASSQQQVSDISIEVVTVG